MEENSVSKPSFWKSYWFIFCMMAAIIAGTILGLKWPGATVLEPMGTLFINAMFCVVVPMVFVSISSAIANMKTMKRAGKVMGVTIVTFLVTAAIAAILMYIVVSIINIVPDNFSVKEMVTKTEEVTDVTVGDLIVNFFTKPDFSELLSRRAMLFFRSVVSADVVFPDRVGGRRQMHAVPGLVSRQISVAANQRRKIVKVVAFLFSRQLIEGGVVLLHPFDGVVSAVRGLGLAHRQYCHAGKSAPPPAPEQ